MNWVNVFCLIRGLDGKNRGHAERLLENEVTSIICVSFGFKKIIQLKLFLKPDMPACHGSVNSRQAMRQIEYKSRHVVSKTFIK